MSSFLKRFHNPLPADAVAIPASARGAFHLPPAAHFSCRPLPPNRGFGGIPRSLSILLLDGNAEVTAAESAATEDGGALNVLAGRKDGNAAELAVADAFVAVLQRLDALDELLAHDLKLRENVR